MLFRDALRELTHTLVSEAAQQNRSHEFLLQPCLDLVVTTAPFSSDHITQVAEVHR